MLRLHSWISETMGADARALQAKMRLLPVMPAATPSSRKRKRPDVDACHAGVMPDAKRPCRDQIHQSHEPSSGAPAMVAAPERAPSGTIRASSTCDEARLRDVIESQFSLEILLKHKELRLIQQELAKCQIALEQLRRCHLVPYPVLDDSAASMVHVMQGTGPAVVPPWAPPYGVVDGPYSRQYASFLRSDARFDGGTHEPAPVQRAHGSFEGRSTRNSSTAESAHATSRPGRASTGSRLPPSMHGTPQPKLRSGPCTLKRNADGIMVKLVCIDCYREDFSSTQGFINHCRIAHHRDFKSHEEAAVACGQAVDVALTPSAHGGHPAAPKLGYVHPIIRGTPSDRCAYTALLSRIEASRELFNRGQLPGVTSIPTLSSKAARASEPSSFVPSSDNPHLSRLLQSRGFQGNLGAIVAEARQRMDQTEEVDGDSCVQQETPINNTPSAQEGSFDAELHNGNLSKDGHFEVQLSPHTISSNNAPSLVSDDEDDGSDAETAKSVIMTDDSDVAEIDIEDEEVRVKRVLASDGLRQKGREDRHVTFVSPVRKLEEK